MTVEGRRFECPLMDGLSRRLAENFRWSLENLDIANGSIFADDNIQSDHPFDSLGPRRLRVGRSGTGDPLRFRHRTALRDTVQGSTVEVTDRPRTIRCVPDDVKGPGADPKCPVLDSRTQTGHPNNPVEGLIPRHVVQLHRNLLVDTGINHDRQVMELFEHTENVPDVGILYVDTDRRAGELRIHPFDTLSTGPSGRQYRTEGHNGDDHEGQGDSANGAKGRYGILGQHCGDSPFNQSRASEAADGDRRHGFGRAEIPNSSYEGPGILLDAIGKDPGNDGVTAQFLGISKKTLASVGTRPLTGGSAIRIEAGNSTVEKLRFNFLTKEYTPTYWFNDTAFMTISNAATGKEEIYKLADTYSKMKKSSTKFGHETGWLSLADIGLDVKIEEGDTVGFGVMNATDKIVSSAILIDEGKE